MAIEAPFEPTQRQLLWRGRRVEDLTREELIAALHQAVTQLEQYRNARALLDDLHDVANRAMRK